MECRYGEPSVGDGVPDVPPVGGRCPHRPARVIPSQCSHWRGNPFPLCGVVRAPRPTSCAVTLRRGRRPRRPVSRGLILPCRGGRLCPPCMTVAPCRAGPMCPAAGYAFFGGARGPRPTGRYVEPPVGDGVLDVPPRHARRVRSFIYWSRGGIYRATMWRRKLVSGDLRAGAGTGHPDRRRVSGGVPDVSGGVSADRLRRGVLA